MKVRNKYSIQCIIAIVLAIALVLSSKFLLKQDFLPFIKWWMALLLLGLIFLPLTQKMFSQFKDNGFLFSKIIGIAISGYLMWFFSAIRLLKFTQNSCFLVIAISILLNILLFYKTKKEDKLSLFSPEKVKFIVSEELLFFAIFLIWVYIRGFKPEANGTEKFMDYGFMTSMMRSDYMPPQDFWFAGTSLNYYYVGQFFACFLTRLSFTSVNYGYNLMLMTLAAFSFVLPYSLVYHVTDYYFKERNHISRKGPAIAGILSGAGVSLAGNLHFSLFYWIVPRLYKFLVPTGEEYPKYWFPNSTRYIGYNPDTNDKTIHEFPSYSFVLGDLHAHVINIIFVLTLLAILFAWLIYQKRRVDLECNSKKEFRLYQELLNPYIVLIGFFIGIFHTTNYWDFPIYYVVAGAVILFSNIMVYRFKPKTLWVTALQGVIIMALAKLIALPFNLQFDKISTDIKLADFHTPLYQLIILWGLPCVLVISLVIAFISQLRAKAFSISDLFVVTIGLCAMGLVLIPEIIYIKDIYESGYQRANTMFKLTYQAFIMFGIASGFIFVRFLKNKKSLWQRVFAGITIFFFATSLWYSKVAVSSWYGNVFNHKNFKGLDAAAFMKTTMPDDYLATEWLNNNIKGMPVVLEANGDSYSNYERVSVITGLPTVLGWYVHEWLWKGDKQIIEDRVSDVRTIYTSTDAEKVEELIDKYHIEYIYVGKLEYEKYPDLNHNFIKSLGETVFYTPSSDNEIGTYIVHIGPKG